MRWRFYTSIDGYVIDVFRLAIKRYLTARKIPEKQRVFIKQITEAVRWKDVDNIEWLRQETNTDALDEYEYEDIKDWDWTNVEYIRDLAGAVISIFDRTIEADDFATLMRDFFHANAFNLGVTQDDLARIERSWRWKDLVGDARTPKNLRAAFNAAWVADPEYAVAMLKTALENK